MWSVKLAGAFSTYDRDVSAKIEESFQKDNSGECRIKLRGNDYTIDFAGMKQRQTSDKSKVRTVKRTATPAPAPAPVPMPAPAPVPAPAPALAPAPTPAPAPAPKRKAVPQDGNAKKKGAVPGAAPRVAAPAPDATPSASGSDLMAKGSNNERIHSMLIELADTEKVKGDKMRSGSYYKAAASVKKFDELITSGKQVLHPLEFLLHPLTVHRLTVHPLTPCIPSSLSSPCTRLRRASRPQSWKASARRSPRRSTSFSQPVRTSGSFIFILTLNFPWCGSKTLSA